ncbi:MAG: T9SS type A sorting domain-containing protein [Ignavibacteria bacterium]|nr:T9SS type A sorting domain-containing protein [Ignavibacteria bacterium]
MKKIYSLIYILPVVLAAFLIYGFSTMDNPKNDMATNEAATNTIEHFNATIGIDLPDAGTSLLYSQDELVSNPGAGFGGANASAITTPGTLFGYGNQQLASNRMADDFTIPAGSSWIIDSIIVFHYQTGSTTASTINNINLQIWDGATPGTGTVVAGDSTTNALTASYFSGIYRVTATTLTNSQRPIMRSSINMNGVSLDNGTYWIDYCAGGTLASGPWNPPRTIAGQPLTGNAFQRLGTTFAWIAAVDGANAQGVPFIIYGTTGPLPVELSSFSSNIIGRDVTLNWTTASELNNSKFEIERSVNNSWTKIGEVAGNGTTSSSSSYSYSDKNLTSNTYNYRLKQIDFNGNFEYFNLSNEVVIGVPSVFELAQNYPNPFNPSTKITYSIPFDGNVSLTVYDAMGKEISRLVDNNQTAGYYSIDFNASNFASGIYYYNINVNGQSNFSDTKKMLLVK